ncbi:MAG TPA: hypothetical protein VMI92_00170 [Steroidobacteraceae bacterium]|nr:hypothetical protein [Steroidobacteraceae bacterium]
MSAPLQHLGVIAVSGADARGFLQGQLSADLQSLQPDRALLASLNNAQGRVQAILTLVAQGECVLMVLPAELASATLARLKPYVLRSKVALADASRAWRLEAADGAAAGPGADAQPGTVVTSGAGRQLKWWSRDRRWLALQPGAADATDQAMLAGHASSASIASSAELDWRRADIATGIPQLNLATREHFVAQMLNLDLLGGISFKKGCYTGQEIIARTQYRGAIKRRLFRFGTASPAPAPGSKLLRGEAAAGEVVEAIDTEHGTELLAVVSLAELHGELRLADGGVPVHPLPLPYEIPPQDP